MNFSSNSYNKPTPEKMRKLGDALLAVSAFIIGMAIAGDNDVIAYISLGIGVVGKFLTNFFAE